MVASKSTPHATHIVLRPNRSASWQDSKKLLLLLSIPIALVAAGWMLVGVWIVLPFAGLELALLAILMYKVSHWTYQQQTILIASQHVKVTYGRRPARVLMLSRPHCIVEIQESENDWPLPAIRLVGPEGEVAVGEFLNLTDRHQLRTDLQNSGLMVCRSHWWKS